MSATTHRAPKWRVKVGRWLAILVIAVIGVSLSPRMAYAWSTSQSATAVCSNSGVQVNATFTNTEPKDSGLDMVVTATVGSKSGGTKTVKVGATEQFTIDLGVYTTAGGTVTFALKWANQAGTDTRTASFGAKNCVPANPGPRTVTTDWLDGAKSCPTATVAQSQTVTKIPQVWSDSAGKYVDAPESEWTSTTESRNRDMTAEEKAQCAGPQPPPDVSYGDWTVAEKSCTAQTVTETQSVTKTPYVRDALGTSWVLDPAHAVTTTETRTRAMTDAEKTICSAEVTKQCISTVGFPADAHVDVYVHFGADSTEDDIVAYGPFAVNQQFNIDIPFDSPNYLFTEVRVVAKDGTVLKTERVTSMTACNVVIPTNPGPRTVTGSVQDGARSCATGTVEQFRIDTIIPRVWDATAGKYVDDTAHQTTNRVDLEPRAMTAKEKAACVTDLPHLQVVASCAGVVTVTNPATNPAVIVLWGDDLVNTEDISGQFTLAPGESGTFTTTFATVDLSFGPTVAGFEPYLQANFATNQSACPVTPPTPTPTPTPTPNPTPTPPTNPGPKTVLVSNDVAGSVSCTERTRLVETSTYSVPQVLVDGGKYTNDPNRAHWTLVGEPTVKSVKLNAAGLSACQQLPNTGSDVSLLLWISLGFMVLGIVLLLANRRLRRVEG